MGLWILLLWRCRSLVLFFTPVPLPQNINTLEYLEPKLKFLYYLLDSNEFSEDKLDPSKDEWLLQELRIWISYKSYDNNFLKAQKTSCSSSRCTEVEVIFLHITSWKSSSVYAIWKYADYCITINSLKFCYFCHLSIGKMW